MSAYHSLTEAERAQVAVGMIDEQIDRIQRELMKREAIEHTRDPALWHSAWGRNPELARDCDGLFVARSLIGLLRAEQNAS
jgi:hypothetical protein